MSVKVSLLHHRLGRWCAAVLGLLAGLLVSSGASAAPATAWTAFDLPKLRQVTLRSASGAPYRIVVASPAGPAPAHGYPVIYVVDGNAWTGFVSEIIRNNVDFGFASYVQPAVVVGIGYPTSKAVDLVRRKLDFTPPVGPTNVDPRIGGGAIGGDQAFRSFIETRVKPLIEANFPIDRHRQTLIGHSLGGLFTLDTIIDHPASYQTYVAISPSIWWDHEALLRKAAQLAERHDVPAGMRVFLSIGSYEQRPTPAYIRRYHDVARIGSADDKRSDAEADSDLAANEAYTMVDNVRKLSAILTKDGVAVREYEFPEEDHFSVVPVALSKAVPFVFANALPSR
jgi:uncharacterized protein